MTLRANSLEFLWEEGMVRGRISDDEIERLADELVLDLDRPESWETLEALTQWGAV